MIWSFTKPQVKSILHKSTKIWLGYIIATLAIVIVFIGFVEYYILTINDKREMHIKQTEQNRQDIIEINKYYSLLQSKVIFTKQLKDYNSNLGTGLFNLFSVVPEQIVLEKFELSDKELILQGTALSIDIYRSFMEAPLKAAFLESEIRYIKQTNGWINFVSINKTK